MLLSQGNYEADPLSSSKGSGLDDAFRGHLACTIVAGRGEGLTMSLSILARKEQREVGSTRCQCPLTFPLPGPDLRTYKHCPQVGRT